MKHQNNGKCPKCRELFDKYPDFHPMVRCWFNTFQSSHPEAHISCAGRGSIEQAAALASKRSKACYGESAHNYNCAIDVFVLLKNRSIYDREWFTLILAPEIPEYLEWYGSPYAKFFEQAHIELRGWKLLKADGKLTLVEEPHARRT